MKFAIISSNDLGNRWDASFHIIRTEYQDRASELALGLSEAEALEMLSDENAFPLEMLHSFDALCRGGNKPDRTALLKAAKEYPHLALAIASENAKIALKKQQEALLSKVDAIKLVESKLEQAQSKSSAIAATMQPLTKEQTSLTKKNRYVRGVIYRNDDQLSVPVETNETYFVADCWVIEMDDWKGVETIEKLVNQGDVPIPVQYGDIGKPIGYVELPSHEQNYNHGWK